MQIQVDSREKAKAITKILKEFDASGVKYHVSKLYVGDYMSLDNPRIIIDRKQNLTELCGNVCQQHERFVGELTRAGEAGIKLIILCEHGSGIEKLENVASWYNPRLKHSPKALTGQRLYKILYSISLKYDVEFVFCKKSETGKYIIKLLNGESVCE